MKKKGLIISTVVMVVVLIAALTTTTFAWFTVQNSTSVDPITVSVDSGSDVLIGVVPENTYTAGYSTDSSHYMNGTLTWSESQWTGGDQDLGYSLNTNLTFTFSKAVYTGQVGTAMDEKESFGTYDTFAMADGSGQSVKTGAAVEEAKENVNYLHIVFGVKAGKENLQSIQCKITVTPQGSRTTYGMNAALYCLAGINQNILEETTGTTDLKPFFSTKKAGDTIGSYSAAENDGFLSYTIKEDSTSPAGISQSDVFQFDVYIFINGWDEDCTNASLGTQCEIKFDFSATPKD